MSQFQTKVEYLVGFANIFYTAWRKTTSPMLDKGQVVGIRENYQYIQNLSHDREEAIKSLVKKKGLNQLPEVDEGLRGITTSFCKSLIAPQFFDKGKYRFQQIATCKDIDYLKWCYNNIFNKERKEIAKLILLDNGYEFDGNDSCFLPEEKSKEEVLLENSNKGFHYNVGDKVELEVTVVELFGFDSRFGWTNVCSMVDENNNLVKYVGGACPLELETGKTFQIKGTIKHDDYRGETHIQRIKVLSLETV